MRFMHNDILDHLNIALTDRYTFEHELGAGGMATVYLAYLGALAASNEFAADPRYKEMLQRMKLPVPE